MNIFNKDNEQINKKIDLICENIKESKLLTLVVNQKLLKLKEQFNNDSQVYFKPKRKYVKKNISKNLMLSDQLCAFLQIPIGTFSNRNTVIEKIIAYEKKNKLYKKDTITLDKDLAYLFGYEGEKINLFNLNKKLSDHFVNNKNI